MHSHASLLVGPVASPRTIAEFRDERDGVQITDGGSATGADAERACQDWKRDRQPPVQPWGVLLWRTEPKSSADLAQLILGPDACLPEGNDAASSAEQVKSNVACSKRCSMLPWKSESVRSARTRINFYWGWERAAVASLAVLLALAILHLRSQRKPLEKQAAALEQWLRLADQDLSPNKPTNCGKTLPEHAQNIQKRFYDRYGRNQKSQPAYDWKTSELTVLRDLVGATQESLNASDRSHLEKFVELQTQALARQQAFINAIITAFPAIGLIATLSSLIYALSRASAIVAGQESECFTNTEPARPRIYGDLHGIQPALGASGSGSAQERAQAADLSVLAW
jgi:hypothetical protein